MLARMDLSLCRHYIGIQKDIELGGTKPELSHGQACTAVQHHLPHSQNFNVKYNAVSGGKILYSIMNVVQSSYRIPTVLYKILKIIPSCKQVYGP